MTADTTTRFARGATRTAAVALALASTGTLADIVDIAWDPSGRFERSVIVAPGKFTEVCGKLPAGLIVAWNFEATVPLDFNVHHHVGKEVLFPAKLTAVATARDTLTTKIDQDYCWMWTNKGAAPASVQVTLKR